jgi:hypothetical protein
VAKKKSEPEVNGTAVATAPELEPLRRPDPPPEPQKDAQEPRNTPVHTIRILNIKGMIWENQGERGIYYGVSFCRLFRTVDQGQEIEAASYSYGLRDLLVIQRVAEKCFEFIEAKYADVPF